MDLKLLIKTASEDAKKKYGYNNLKVLAKLIDRCYEESIVSENDIEAAYHILEREIRHTAMKEILGNVDELKKLAEIYEDESKEIFCSRDIDSFEDIKGTAIEKLADVWIRLATMTNILLLSNYIEEAIRYKMAYNKVRTGHKKGKQKW